MAEAPALLLRITNDAAGVSTALDQLAEHLEAAGYGSEVTGRVMVVADEVVSNVARCAFPGNERHQFTLALVPDLHEGRPQLRLSLEDAGFAFDPTDTAVPDVDLPIEERQAGGLGMHLVRSMSRSLSYARQDGLNRLDILLDASPD